MVSNKEIAEAFRIAKEIHASGKTAFICHATCQAYNTSHISADILNICIRIIKERLDGCITVDEWLIDNGVDSREMTPEAMFKYRQAWLDKLIEEFSNDDWYLQDNI